jgi:hypothetical protein
MTVVQSEALFARPTFRWHGLAIDSRTNADGLLRYEFLRASRFALIEMQRLSELPEDFPTQPVVAEHFGCSAHLMPHLVDLQALRSEHSAWLLGELDRAYAAQEQAAVAVLLQSTAPIDFMQSHLRQAQTRSYQSLTAWQRLHDPWVFLQLPRVLSIEEMRRLFGPIEAWAVCLGGAWHICTVDAGVTTAKATGDKPAPSSSDSQQAQWAALLRIGAVNRALMQRGWLLLPDVIRHSAHLDALVQRAESVHGLSRAGEQAGYAVLGAELPVDFDEHPAIAAAIRAHQNQNEGPRDSSIVDALNALPAATWQQVERELSASTSAPSLGRAI